MKKNIVFRFIFLSVISMFLWSAGTATLQAQNNKKNAIRLKADYIKTMNQEVAFKIKAFARIDRQTVDIPNIELIVSYELGDDEVTLGNITTNDTGECNFIVKDPSLIKPDSLGFYNVSISFKGNDLYKRASKSLTYRDAAIDAKIITKDSVNYITAVLKDTAKDSVLSDQILNVQVQRLFRPLKMGPDFNSTDENGTIIVPVEKGIPGVNGMLTFEVVLKDSDDYGTVKALVNAPLGVPVVDESTYDQRTMWSPRNKTPLFLLIFPNLIILGIWGFIVYLFINLFKISKSKI